MRKGSHELELISKINDVNIVIGVFFAWVEIHLLKTRTDFAIEIHQGKLNEQFNFFKITIKVL